jgi:hypothetical protein
MPADSLTPINLDCNKAMRKAGFGCALVLCLSLPAIASAAELSRECRFLLTLALTQDTEATSLFKESDDLRNTALERYQAGDEHIIIQRSMAEAYQKLLAAIVVMKASADSLTEATSKNCGDLVAPLHDDQQDNVGVLEHHAATMRKMAPTLGIKL